MEVAAPAAAGLRVLELKPALGPTPAARINTGEVGAEADAGESASEKKPLKD